jgi:hypothetical protein
MPRVKIPVSFGFTSNPTGTTPTYVASSSGGSANESANLLEAPTSVAVTVTSRTTGQPATVYQAETGPALFTTNATDGQGNVPGWVDPGSYTVTAAAASGFSGATVAFEAVRGDGVTNVAAGAVDVAQLTAAVLNALVPTGTVLDYTGQSTPAGFVFANNAVYPTGAVGSTYYNLSQICGTRWNTGSEGNGNFRVPDLRGVALVGAGTNSRIATSARSLASLGGDENLQVHAHSISDPGHAHGVADPGHGHGVFSTTANDPAGGPVSGGAEWTFGSAEYVGAVYTSLYMGNTNNVGTGIGIYGAGTNIGIQNAGSGGAQNMQPFVVTNKIIKL